MQGKGKKIRDEKRREEKKKRNYGLLSVKSIK